MSFVKTGKVDQIRSKRENVGAKTLSILNIKDKKDIEDAEMTTFFASSSVAKSRKQ